MKFFSRLFFLFFILFFVNGCGTNSEEKKITASQKTDTLIVIDSTVHTKNEKLTYVQAYDKTLTLWNTPFVEKNIKTSFGNAHVIISGPVNAEPLVLLHGMNASSTMWYPNIKALSEQYRIYAIDFLLEPGKSFCQPEICGNNQIVKWYDEIFDELNLKKFNLMGASRGGWLALDIALHSRSRINKMVLLSPAQTFIWIRPGPGIISNISYSINPKRKRLRNALESMTFNVDKISQVFIDQYYIATKEATLNKCMLQMTPFSDKQLKSLTMPVLVLIGDNDIVNNDKSLEQAKKTFPNVETEKIGNAGHFLSIDQPEIVDKRVLDFLNESKALPEKRHQ